MNMVNKIGNNSENTLTQPPQRSDTHRIDTDAVRVVRTLLTSDWIERSVEDRDYGIDMMLEAFDGKDPTGTLVLFQIKGHEASFGTEPVTFSVPVKTLLYARMFQAPFFLVHVSNTDRKAHFVWLQKYIDTRLSADSPRWDRQAHVTIHFPNENILATDGLQKIRALALHAAHRDVAITFMRHLFWLRRHVDEFQRSKSQPEIEQALIRLKEIRRLEPFLAAYEDFCPELDIDQLRNALKKAKVYGAFDFGDEDLVDVQLGELFAIQMMFLDKDESDVSTLDALDSGFPY
ncbi:DUF4365 domain-containing protein [Hydrogenophaga sp. 2FB]|uniref:DUF4365 domain-containing protein n=1 Tax=Hydrogenophaga sp. 2FB TaxID=2502187 RepID=UPI0010F578C3|nr:DUF4365 domain-containing protein [Hydrogenophaga sp. 2FB]